MIKHGREPDPGRCDTWAVSVDIENMLRRVVGDEFSANSRVEYSTDPKSDYIFRARISDDSGRDVGLRATASWLEANIWGLDPNPKVVVGATFFDEDDDEPYKEALLRSLARVLRAYLDGRGHVERRKSLLLHRWKPHYLVSIDGMEWRFSHRTAQMHYPDSPGSDF